MLLLFVGCRGRDFTGAALAAPALRWQAHDGRPAREKPAMTFDTWIADAWNRHADAPAAVLAEIPTTGAPLAADDAAIGRLLHLAQHIAGAHQGGPAELAAGRALLATLAALPAAGPAAQANAALYGRALALTGGDAAATAGLPPAEAVRATALAASNLADREAARAGALLQQAVAAAEAAVLPDADPAVRALAVAGNNIAAALEEKAGRDADETRLMLYAAQVARHHWARAGTWLETERAEYRLAMSHLQAGDLPQARQHAQHCLEIVQAQGSVPLEAFFGWEALGRVDRAAGNSAGHQHALAQAGAAFAAMSEADQAWCRASLDQLRDA